MSLLLFIVLTISISLYLLIIQPLWISHEGKIPGSKLYALTKWRLAYDDWQGRRTRQIENLHQQHGSVVRIGPNEVHFNSLSALRTIYGAGSGFERTFFYRMFDAYGTQNLFTFHSSKQHADRKKLIANAYSKSIMMRANSTRMIETKVKLYLDYLARNNGLPDEIFTSLHYFSIDAITHFLYGPDTGGTSAMAGNTTDRALLIDILDPARRRLSWFAVHLPPLTKWLYTRSGLMERLVRPFLPMQKPATYSQIRQHALKAWSDFKSAAEKADVAVLKQQTIISLLWQHHVSQKAGGLQDLDIASECADHLLAGIDTTADTLMSLVWALSLPANSTYQSKLIEEVRAIESSSLNSDGLPTVQSTESLPYLNAVIKETLRLYAPLPATEPRSINVDTIIDGYQIPAGTIVGMSPFSLHRNPQVFTDPLTFNPERWFSSGEKLKEMNKWFWAFSSGARMCIGIHLAMAEMTTLVAAIYRTYGTSIAPLSEGHAPAITSRFEMFYDERAESVKEHECHITFVKH